VLEVTDSANGDVAAGFDADPDTDDEADDSNCNHVLNGTRCLTSVNKLGRVAQRNARFPDTEEVAGSIPAPPTMPL
jgi:hypothetical protein